MTTSAQQNNECFIHTALQEGPVSISPLGWPADCGAECIFLGRTRLETHPKRGQLQRIIYHTYHEMAETKLHEIAVAASKKFPLRAIRIVHAHGPVPPSHASVIIQTATPHRSESFEATKFVIDTLKHAVPIWKQEIWADNSSTWVKGCIAHDLSESPNHDPDAERHTTPPLDLPYNP
ncbi:molybdenum cofactor biosynthesis protein MoaE [Planctomycetota bacterium]|nr:molybdenum cofactor biosynthesis protein MoaE [Planctomycetota bacterium]